MNDKHFGDQLTKCESVDFSTADGSSGSDAEAAILRALGEVVFATTADGCVTFVGSGSSELLGLLPEEWLGKSLGQVVECDDLVPFFDDYSRNPTGLARMIRRSVRVVDQLGRSVLAELMLKNASPSAFEAASVVGSLRVLSALDARSTTERPFESVVFDSAPVAIFACDSNGELMVVNRAAGDLLDGSLSVGDSRRAGETTHPDPETAALRRLVLDSLDRALLGDEFRGDTGNEERSIAVSAHPIFGHDGIVIGAVGAAYDTTALTSAKEALRVSEEQLMQSQKMEAVGRLAGGVAHDFNNLLTIITGYSDLIVHRVDLADPVREFAEEVRKASRRASMLTQQLLAFSRKQILQPRVLDLNASVEDMATMLDRLLGEDVDLVTNFGVGLWRVKADPGQVVQVALNLAVNARDAMPDGGTLTLATANERVPVGRDTRYGHIPAGDYVRFTVRDTGCGMSADVLDHIFEPFFTTKERGKGTGLGLATVYGVVRQSGGAITVETELHQGTKFHILLPRVEGEIEPAVSSVSLPQVPDGAGTILLVEDEDGVRMFVKQTLESAGYAVLVASDGADALRVSEEYGEQIDLLLTDVVMPGMNGRELSERLKPTRDAMRVLFMSGYTDDAVVKHGVMVDGRAFIQKPFSPSKLVRTVSELLTSS